ncbi:hypothetical protein [Klebsiella pneumoniae]|nr:hypothetical protein [Klebsiella pneumoniae]
MTADQIIEGILGKEDGYVDHPSDKGGPALLQIVGGDKLIIPFC